LEQLRAGLGVAFSGLSLYTAGGIAPIVQVLFPPGVCEKMVRPHTAIEVQHVDLTYAGGVRALRNVCLSVAPGEFVSIVGPSGCGKSTLLRLIAGLLGPSKGAISVGGQSPADARRQSQTAAYVFQDATLLPWRTVAQNVRLPLELRRAPLSQQAEVIEHQLRLIGLESFSTRLPAELSGGMRMRASLARALVTQPELLLLDEPFGALDDISRTRLQEELHRLWLADRWTGLLVTHNINEAVFLSQRVLVMSARPGTMVSDLPVALPEERTRELRASPEFARVCGAVASTLWREAA
jgi:NitT/TauT family transport system ATP-binding protein